MSLPETEPLANDAAEAVGDAEAFRLLAGLVSIAPTNLEDSVHGRFEKPNYLRAADLIVRWARHAGLRTRVFDPVIEGPPQPSLRGIPRPNVIVDLDVGAQETVLLLAHYDVVPVPAEQLARWKSPPHSLSWRSDGRLYGRGTNDDLGSGVVASLLAMKHLAAEPNLDRNVRLLACCDEETGGLGGIEAIRARDERLPRDDPDRFLRGIVALIPDGAPRVNAACSGGIVLHATFSTPPSLSAVLRFGVELVHLHEHAMLSRSAYPSPDWPSYGAPAPVITGRATVTQWDFESRASQAGPVELLRVHAESDASNQIPQAVTLVFSGRGANDEFADRIRDWVPSPYRLEGVGSSSLPIPSDALALQLVGKSAHGGYPHRGHNPVPPAIELLGRAVREDLFEGSTKGAASFTVDIRLIPEMSLEEGNRTALSPLRAWIDRNDPTVRLETPEDRCRAGSTLAIDHPVSTRMERIMREVFGVRGVVGEYGGTDASSLVGMMTPSGQPLPAVVFGSMDRRSNIHDAEENVDPRALAKVAKVIERFVREP